MCFQKKKNPENFVFLGYATAYNFLNGFPLIKKFNTKNVTINSVRVKMKVIISIERATPEL